MTEDESAIRELIERWARAVHAGDLDTVLADHAEFEIVELEVTAGADVAFAYALLRCGTSAEFEANPDNLLRMTVGLRKVSGRWTVAHEHHSFPLVD